MFVPFSLYTLLPWRRLFTLELCITTTGVLKPFGKLPTEVWLRNKKPLSLRKNMKQFEVLQITQKSVHGTDPAFWVTMAGVLEKKFAGFVQAEA